MKKLVVGCLAVAAVVLATVSDAQATCFRRGGHGDCCAPAPSDCCAPQMVCQTVTCWQPVWKEREIEVTVLQQVQREEKFEYVVCIPVTTQEKRKVTCYQTVTNEVEFKYTVCVPVTTVEKRKVVCYKTVTNEVEFKYTVCVPVTTVEKRKVVCYRTVTNEVEFTYFENVCTTTQEKRKVTQYTCVPTQVQVQVPCWTTVMVPECIPPSCCNPCGGVRYRCERVCTMQTVTRTVLQQVPQEVEVLV